MAARRVASGEVWRRPGWHLLLHRVRGGGCRFLLWARHRDGSVGCEVVVVRRGESKKLPGVGAVVAVESTHPHPGGWYYAAVTLAPARRRPDAREGVACQRVRAGGAGP